MDPTSDVRASERPWPVSYMQPASAELFDRAVSERGRSLESVLAATLSTWSGENMMTQALAYALGAWHVFGRQCFRIAPLLAEAFRETSLAKVPSEYFRSPYLACWIEAPLPLTSEGPPFFGFFLIERTFEKDVLLIRNKATQAAPALGTAVEPYPPGTRFIQAIVVGPDQNLFATDLYLVRENLEESIALSHETMRKRRAAAGQPIEEHGQDEMALRLWSFASNVALYLSSPDPDLQIALTQGLEKPPTSRKAREIQERIRKREGEVRLLGYRLTRVVRGGPHDTRETVLAADGNRSVAAHLVRGHWKSQPHGPGSAERKIIWIAPYRRGDDGSEERLERTYTV